jgi:hypothetical protein
LCFHAKSFSHRWKIERRTFLSLLSIISAIRVVFDQKMNPEREIEKRIEKQRRENDELVARIDYHRRLLAEGQGRLAALEEALQILRKDPGAPVLRPGTTLHKVAEILREAGKPLHISEILPKLGKEVNRKTRATLTGSLGTYIRNKVIFDRPAPNTFGLIEFTTEGQTLPLQDQQPQNDTLTEKEKPDNVVNLA